MIHQLLFSLFTAFLVPAEPSITLKVTGLRPSVGSVFVAVYDAKNYLKDGDYVATKIARVGNASTVTIALADIPSGIYALAVYQDLNNNKKLDKNLIGVPTEPFGFSNNVKILFSAPAFADTKFTHSPIGSNLTINVQMW